MSARALLWFAFLGPPAAWTLHLVVGYGIEEIACSPGTVGQDILGLDTEVLIAAVTAFAAATAAAAGVAGLLVHRRASRGRIPDARGRLAFMSGAGVLASVIFLVIILLGGLQILGAESCARA